MAHTQAQWEFIWCFRLGRLLPSRALPKWGLLPPAARLSPTEPKVGTTGSRPTTPAWRSGSRGGSEGRRIGDWSCVAVWRGGGHLHHHRPPMSSRARQLRHCSAAKGDGGLGRVRLHFRQSGRDTLIWKYTEKTASIPKFLKEVDILKSEGAGEADSSWDLGEGGQSRPRVHKQLGERRDGFMVGVGGQEAGPASKPGQKSDACSPSCIRRPRGAWLSHNCSQITASEEQTCLYIARIWPRAINVNFPGRGLVFPEACALT